MYMLLFLTELYYKWINKMYFKYSFCIEIYDFDVNTGDFVTVV